jgi:hypothetical protein
MLVPSREWAGGGQSRETVAPRASYFQIRPQLNDILPSGLHDTAAAEITDWIRCVLPKCSE